MTRREQIVDLLKEKQPYLAKQYNVKRIGLFGSYAAGIPDEKSDIDLIVEFDGPIGFRFIELSEYLENLLERKAERISWLIRKHKTPSYATWKLSARRPRISAGICGTSTGMFPGKAWPE